MHFVLGPFCARRYSLISKSHGRVLCMCRHNAARRLQADFEANSIACSPLLCCIMRLEYRHLVLLIKVSNQMEVIWRWIPPALTVMESVISVVIVSLTANGASVGFDRPLWASQIMECECTESILIKSELLVSPRFFVLFFFSLPKFDNKITLQWIQKQLCCGGVSFLCVWFNQFGRRRGGHETS